MPDTLAPQSLEQWREEREAEKRTADIAAFTAHYLDATDDRVIGRRDERIRKGVELGLLNEQAADELLRTAADAALEAMANGCSGAKAYHDVSDTEFSRMARGAVGALDQVRAHQLANHANIQADLRALARGEL